jgi:hypothetical protein
VPVKTHSFRDRFAYDLHPAQVWLRLAVPPQRCAVPAVFNGAGLPAKQIMRGRIDDAGGGCLL